MSKEAIQKKKRNRGVSPVGGRPDTDSLSTTSISAADQPLGSGREYLDLKMPSRSRTFPSTPDSMDTR